MHVDQFHPELLRDLLQLAPFVPVLPCPLTGPCATGLSPSSGRCPILEASCIKPSRRQQCVLPDARHFDPAVDDPPKMK